MADPLQYAYRTLKGIGVVNADPVYEPLPGLQSPEGSIRCSVYSPCGRFFAWASSEELTVIDASTGAIINSLSVPNVYELCFSPKGTFIMTWERPGKDEDGNGTKNLKVWRVATTSAEPTTTAAGEDAIVGKFVQRSQTGWHLQYTSDEHYCARLVTNEIQFYHSRDLGAVSNKLRVEGVADFALSTGDRHSVAVFLPERKGQPAAVKVFNLPDVSNPVSQKTFFKGDKVQLKWNDRGTNLIVLAQTEVDKTGKSYYGETNLYLLSANGDFDTRVQLDKEGPIHDVIWSPNSTQFGVVYGYMPAKSTIFNTRAVAIHSFPLGPRNTICFSPDGRFVLVAGFGNLAGQIDVYDGEKDYQKLATIESGNPSVCRWSPDGRFILTATTSPRLRVDNGVKIWHVGGSMIYHEDMTELYDVLWRPATATTDARAKDPLLPIPTLHASARAYLGAVKTPSKPAGAYRPPGARGQVTPLHFKREDEGGAAHVRNGVPSYTVHSFGKAPRRREVPGAEAATLPPGAAPGGGVSLTGAADPGADDSTLSKAALKNKKKREAKKQAKEAADGAQTEEAAAMTTGGDGARPRPPVRTPSRNGGHARSRSRTHASAPDGDGSREGPPSAGHGADASRDVSGTTTASMSEPGPASEATGDGSADAPGGSGGSGGSGGGGSQPEQKRLRGLLKKLRAIVDLKMRLAGGEKLEETQMKKIESEDGVIRELAEIGWNG
ncbi:MAG: hypothetical protein M1826_006532 [Phylliscum demangeonii]|nr:MAG: hypothetical protein M1826_006532 [Phylliscum demangeonii]